MNPHQKAIELTNRFVAANMEEVGELAAAIVSKECALIAVEEIIKAIPDASDTDSPYHHELVYWQQVQKQIETL